MSWRAKSFEVLPALRVGGKPLRRALRTVTTAWMFGVVWMSCISGSQMTLFGRLLGFSDLDFGILGSLPFAATFAQLVAAVLIERTGVRKYRFIYYAAIHRMLWLVVGAVPLLLKPGRAAIATFLAVYTVSNILGQMAMPPWQTWMADLIPRRIRGRYLADRRIWTLPIQIFSVLVAGLILDQNTVAGAPMTIAAQPALLVTISALFAIGAVFGTIDVLLFLRVREIVSPPLLRPSAARRKRWVSLTSGVSETFGAIRAAFTDRVFRNYALYGATIAFSMTVGGQFFWLNALENLGYSKLGANAVFLVCGAVTSLLTARLWGRLIDSWGRRPILILATVGVVFSPAGWFLIPPGRMFLAYLFGVLACMVGGAMWSAINLAQISTIWGFSETSGRSKYVAAAAVVAAIGGFAGGLTGGAIAQTLRFMQADPIYLGPFPLINYHVNFLASMCARALSLIWLIGMPDQHARPFRDVLRQIRFNAYNNVMPRLFGPVRAWTRFLQQRRSARERRPPRPG